MRTLQPGTKWRDRQGERDDLRDGMWWYFCMPHGVWWCRDGTVVLFNRARRPMVAFDPKQGLHVPGSSQLFKRAWQEWDGPTPCDGPDDTPVQHYEVEHEKRFYNNFNGPWLGGRAAAETRLRIMLILVDFLEGRMPERGGKK